MRKHEEALMPRRYWHGVIPSEAVSLTVSKSIETLSIFLIGTREGTDHMQARTGLSV
jgi:hypothetical protein